MRKTISLLLLLLPLFMKAEEARLLRFPSVGGEKIAFSYAGDLYTVSVDGGEAHKLTSHVGYEVFSRFSPDGKTIAFTGQYDGNTEVYTIPAEGGTPYRVTYTATLDRDDIGDRMGPNNIIACWTPDGKNIVFRTRWYTFSGLRGLLFSVPAEGGDLTQIPSTEGGFCSFSPDGNRLAMNRMFREFRTWKYYRGGQADDIWINTVGTTKLENITNNDAQDIFPMWVGDKIYFLSDRDHIMNLFCYDTATKKSSKLTDFKEYDCKFPSYSSKYIVFENGGYIYKYTIATQKCEKVKVTLHSDDLYARSVLSPQQGKGPGFRMGRGYSLSPDGQRVVASVRGDIFSLPATTGATYNLTPATSASHERDAVWSPDGKYIAFFSDRSGEYQVYIMDPTDPTKITCLTKFKNGYPSSLSWTPDSKSLLFTNEKKEILSVGVSSKEVKSLFKGDYGPARNYKISADGSWMTFTTSSKNGVSVVYLYEMATGKYHPVTTTWYDSYYPCFSDDGKYLFYTSARGFQSRYSAVEWNASYSLSSNVFVVPLSKDTPNPALIKGDEYLPKSANDDVKDKKPQQPKEVQKQKMSVDLDGIVERSIALPLGSGTFQLIGGFEDCLYFSTGGEIKKISMKDMKVSSVTKARINAFTADRSKALIHEKGNMYVTSTKSLRGDKPISTDGLRVMIDYPAEWRQIFDETWRVYRDHFYLENMHGKNWKAIHDKYAVLLPYVKHRQDLTYIIGEMISELNVGHAYVTTGDAPRADRVQVGLLGGKFSKDKSGFFKIDKIFKGEDWTSDKRSPLAEYGLGVSVGDFILAVNGVNCKDLKSIYEPLVGKVGQIISLKVNDKPSLEGAKFIYVKPIASESKLAYFEWVQNNIKKVDEASNGQIGYIHIPDMGTAGLDEFTKLFYTQLDKKALIIDDRMNGGGNVSPMIIERLQRVVYRMNMSRNGSITPGTIPESTHYGPKVCLIDKYSSSDGDLFPYGFQKLGLGKVIGVRSWGGIVGISASLQYVDGQDVRTPFFTSFSTEGEWIVENHGVDPDIVVDINPFEDYLGNDAQLNKAVEILLEELKTYKELPQVPAPRKMP